MHSRLKHRQRGQTLPLAALATIAVLGGLAMVVDAGTFFVIQRQLQAAADAGALAGAWYSPVCPDPMSGCRSGDAIAVARQIANDNAVAVASLCGASVTVNANVGTPDVLLRRPANVNWIVVEATCSAGFSFGRILNLDRKTVSASSAAAIGVRDNNGDMTDFVSRVTPCPTGFSPPCLVARLVE